MTLKLNCQPAHISLVSHGQSWSFWGVWRRTKPRSSRRIVLQLPRGLSEVLIIYVSRILWRVRRCFSHSGMESIYEGRLFPTSGTNTDMWFKQPCTLSSFPCTEKSDVLHQVDTWHSKATLKAPPRLCFWCKCFINIWGFRLASGCAQFLIYAFTID